MTFPLDIWAPVLRAPFSGDVTQAISPRVMSPEIKGVPEIEDKVQTEVASYGKQLGKILEALQVLAEEAKISLPKIDEIVEGVEQVKIESRAALKADAEAALARLRKADEAAWRGVIAGADRG